MGYNSAPGRSSGVHIYLGLFFITLLGLSRGNDFQPRAGHRLFHLKIALVLGRLAPTAEAPHRKTFRFRA
jgi:hypothetical protein